MKIGMNKNPWVDRFDLAISDDALDRLIEIRAESISIGNDTPEVDGELLREALKRVFLSSIQIRTLLRELMGLARAHAKINFGSEEQYMGGLYKVRPWGSSTAPAVFLTGLAGVGKSDLLLALSRALTAPTEIDVPGIKHIPLICAWQLSLCDGVGMNTLLRPILEPAIKTADGADINKVNFEEKAWKLPTLLKLSRQRTWRDGVCLLWVDEFQYITKSQDASAKATTMLMQLLGIGPRLIFCANYSFGHKLKNRNNEDTHRLLSCPKIVEPESSSSADWIALLTELKKVVPEVFVFNVNEVENLIHQYTFGVKRLVVELLVLAYKVARKKGENIVSVDDIKLAYISTEYTYHRKSVETLWRQTYENINLKDDLWCPFDQSREPTNVVKIAKATKDFESRIEDKILESSLSPAEAIAAKSIDSTPEKPKQTARVFSISKKSKITKESLLKGCEMFDSPTT
jgi:hypothetical protein